MSKNHKAAPIGIFDSGVGGLTVAHAIKKKMPHESIFFYGDTLHLPYGDKSEQSIKSYSENIADFLVKQDCKMLVIACNSASVSAYKFLAQKYPQLPIVNVINPLVEELGKLNDLRTVGIIGTKRTIDSKVYQEEIKRSYPGINVIAKATPLLAPMIEEGFIDDEVCEAVLKAYLAKSLLEVDSLILACTHYPLLKKSLTKLLPSAINILDSTDTVAADVQRKLEANGSLNTLPTDNTEETVKDQFWVSDYTEAFGKQAKYFFGSTVELTCKNISSRKIS